MLQGDVAVIASGLTGGERIVVSDLPYAVDGMLLAPQLDAGLEQRLITEAEGHGDVMATEMPYAEPAAPGAGQ